MNSYQKRLLTQILANCKEAAHQRYLAEVQMQLDCCPIRKYQKHCQAVMDLRGKTHALLLDLMNSGMSHRRFLRLIKDLESQK